MSALSFWHHHIGLSVPDLDESIAWYETMLDFTLFRRSHIADIPADIAMLKNGNMHIELLCVEGANPLPEDRRTPELDIHTHGTKHGCFETDDVVATAEELKRRGAEVLWVREYAGGRQNCFVRDNAGNLIEFVRAVPN
ncbi:VOC family protein [Alteromonas sp. NFXS44]|uniref:VOC family protein n=1 Tax=Alteromonas sp. NFXS44 TaxID=2818435 RepID=UPI0032DEFE1C